MGQNGRFRGRESIQSALQGLPVGLAAKLKPGQVAKKQFPVLSAEMHPVALALLPPSATGAGAGLEGRMVPEKAEAMLPHIHKIVLVDIALTVRSADAGAAGNGTVYSHRRNA